MSKRVCAHVGCPALVDSTAYRGRCAEHLRQWDAQRGTREQRGYGNEHRAVRAALVAHLGHGTLTCWRCGLPIMDARSMHVGHDDHDRSITRGPEHASCNLRAAGAKGREATGG